MWPTIYIPASGSYPRVYEYSAPMIHPWLASSADLRNPLNTHEYKVKNHYVDVTWRNFTDTFADFYTYHAGSGGAKSNNALIDTVQAWSLIDGDNGQEAVGPIDFSNAYEAVEAYLWFLPDFGPGTLTQRAKVAATGSATEGVVDDLTAGAGVYHSGCLTAGSMGHGYWLKGTAGDEPAGITWSNTFDGPGSGLSAGQRLNSLLSQSIVVRRQPSPPEGDGWETVSGTAKALAVYNETLGSGYYSRTESVYGTSYTFNSLYRPDGTMLIPTDANYSSQAWWEAAYATAVSEGRMPSGLVYGTHYPVTISSYYRRAL